MTKHKATFAKNETVSLQAEALVGRRRRVCRSQRDELNYPPVARQRMDWAAET